MSYHVRIGSRTKICVIPWLLLVMRVIFLTSFTSVAFPSWNLNTRVEIEKILHKRKHSLYPQGNEEILWSVCWRYTGFHETWTFPANAILCQLNSFHSNLRSTIHKFEDENVHFLDISQTELLRIFTGKTQTLASISLPPVMHLGLIRPLGLELCSNRTSHICDNDSLFQKQISVIKTFLSGNGFLDLLCLTSLNVSGVVAPSQDHSTMILARQFGFDCLMQATLESQS